MKRNVVIVLLAAGFGAPTFAATEAEATEVETEVVETLSESASYQAVDSFSTLGGLHSFRPIDNSRLIVWRTAFEPYLIELDFPSVDLRFSEGVAIESTTSRVFSRFDTVTIRGIKYPIGAIYKLSREQARAL